MLLAQRGSLQRSLAMEWVGVERVNRGIDDAAVNGPTFRGKAVARAAARRWRQPGWTASCRTVGAERQRGVWSCSC